MGGMEQMALCCGSKMFPHDPVPDGAVFAPHHYTYALGLVLLVVAVVWDDYRHREPLFAALGASVGLFGFLLVWRYYPPAGAILSLAGPVVTIGAVLLGSTGTAVGDVWDDYPLRYRVATVLFSLVALDDAVEHAFGWPTPLDQLWVRYLSDRVALTAVIALALLLGVGVVVAVYGER